MKRHILKLLCAVLLLCLPARAAQWSRTEGDGSYITVHIPYEQANELSWAQSRYLSVRYRDSGEPVPLTSAWRISSRSRWFSMVWESVWLS